MYHLDPNKELCSTALCFISDGLDHDVNFVYQVLKGTVSFIRSNLPVQIDHIYYFSDGCAGQFKNCKNFLNLCYHKSDFGMTCEWNFFATSHGKSPCDGLGGTVKRLATHASLRRPLKEQIITAINLYDYCMTSIKGINFAFISNEELAEVRKEMKSRLDVAKTVPGTRSFHQFQPLSSSTIGAKYVSTDETYECQYSFFQEQVEFNEEQVEFNEFNSQTL